MPSANPHVLFSLIAPAGMLLAFGCARGTSTTGPSQTPAAVATTATSAGVAPSSTATATVIATATIGATALPGSTFTIGTWTVAVDRFRAQVNQSDGINIRSTPEVKPDNRTGSLPGGATVEVEGRVDAGQEAVAGQGTTWYYLCTAGQTPQFVYGATGTLTQLNGSATATPPASPSTSSAPVTATP
jgi:hypothetical protein